MKLTKQGKLNNRIIFNNNLTYREVYILERELKKLRKEVLK
jgi:hypothetical protein